MRQLVSDLLRAQCRKLLRVGGGGAHLASCEPAYTSAKSMPSFASDPREVTCAEDHCSALDAACQCRSFLL